MNMYEVSRTITIKSVIAGEYTAPPAQGPMIAEICGTTPDDMHVAQKDVGVAGQRNDAFLDARAARVVDPDHRASDLRREIHDFADFLGEGARKAAAKDGKILRKDADLAAVDSAVTGDDAIAGDLSIGHAEIGVAMGFELIELDERSPVEQKLDPFARGQAPRFALTLELILAAGSFGLTRKFVNAFDILF